MDLIDSPDGVDDENPSCVSHHLLLLAAQQVLHEAMTHHLCLWDQLSDELLAIIQALSIRTSCCCDNVATSVHGSLWSQGYGNCYESSRHWQGTFIQTIIILGVQLGFSRAFFLEPFILSILQDGQYTNTWKTRHHNTRFENYVRQSGTHFPKLPRISWWI